MKSPEIIEAGQADVDSILPLFLGYLQFYKQRTNAKRARQFISERLERGESKILLAVLDNEPVGFVQLYPTYASLSMKRSWVLYDLFVKPDARKRGVAKALMERARQLAVETGADGLILDTAVDNLPAQRLYESLGWKRDVEFFRYFLRT